MSDPRSKHVLALSAQRLAFPALLGGAVCIAFAPIFVRLSETGPIATAFYRMALSLPLLWAWMKFLPGSADRRPRSVGDYGVLILAGVFFAADLAVWHWSITLTAVANATLFANFAPVFVTLGSWWLFGERFTRTFLVSIGLGIAGAAILMGDSLNLRAQNFAGDVLGLTAAVFYGAYLLTVSRLRRSFSTAVIMTWSGLASAAILLPLAWVSGDVLFPVSAYGWGVLVALALLSHAGGQSLIAHALAHLSAAFSSVSLLLQPVVASLLAWLLLAEPLRAWQGIGGLLVLAAIALARHTGRATTSAAV